MAGYAGAVPEGFFLIRVPVTAAEYKTMRDLGILTGEGTPAAGLRVKAGLPESAHGIKTARLRDAIADADEWYAEHGLLDGDITTHATSTGEDL